MSGFEEWYKKIFTEGGLVLSSEYAIAKVGYRAGRADRQQQDVQIAMNAASHSVADIAKAQAISDLIAEAD